MRLILNIIWLVLCGWWMAIAYALADPATPARERKRIARLLLTDVTVTRTRDTITRTSACPPV